MKRLIILLLLLLVSVAYFSFRSMNDIPTNSIKMEGNGQKPITAKDDLRLDNPSPSRESRLRSILESNNAPIQFYGIVVDEEGNTLPDVEVAWSVIKSGAFATAVGIPTGARGIVQTDLSGKFSITENGTSVNVGSLKKEGFHEAQQTMRSFGYGNTNTEPHQPDQSNPQQFLLIKNGAAAVLKKEMNLAFDWDGIPKQFEIGIKDIKETLILVPNRSVIPKNLNDLVWQLVVKIQNGQVIRAKKGDGPLAPNSGFTDEIILGNEVGAAKVGNGMALFYVKTATGKYGKIRIDTYPERGSEDGLTAGLSIRWNPTGGRSFE